MTVYILHITKLEQIKKIIPNQLTTVKFTIYYCFLIFTKDKIRKVLRWFVSFMVKRL